VKGHGIKGKNKITPANVVLIAVALIEVVAGSAGAFLLKASEKPSFCASCHNMKPYYASWAKSSLLANKHAQAGVTCHDCHQESLTDKMGEGVKYVTGNYESPMQKRNIGTREFCLKCHDFDKIKTQTDFSESNPHDSHNGQQDCNLCHNMHRQSKVMCSQCHNFDWINKLDESWTKS